MKKTIYYAHHLWKYDTEIEKFELGLIKEKLSNYEILNPNKYFSFSEDITEEEIMNVCLKTVCDCEALVFSSLSGIIGRGVYMEVGLAMDLKKDVYYIHEDNLIKVNSICFRPCRIKSNRTYMVLGHIEREMEE